MVRAAAAWAETWVSTQATLLVPWWPTWVSTLATLVPRWQWPAPKDMWRTRSLVSLHDPAFPEHAALACIKRMPYQ